VKVAAGISLLYLAWRVPVSSSVAPDGVNPVAGEAMVRVVFLPVAAARRLLVGPGSISEGDALSLSDCSSPCQICVLVTLSNKSWCWAGGLVLVLWY
jgi:hypothetical protein